MDINKIVSENREFIWDCCNALNIKDINFIEIDNKDSPLAYSKCRLVDSCILNEYNIYLNSHKIKIILDMYDNEYDIEIYKFIIAHELYHIHESWYEKERNMKIRNNDIVALIDSEISADIFASNMTNNHKVSKDIFESHTAKLKILYENEKMKAA